MHLKRKSHQNSTKSMRNHLETMWDDKPNSVSRLQTGHLTTDLFHNSCHRCAGHDDYDEVDNDSDSDDEDGDDDGDGDDGDGESNLCHLVQV